MADLITDQLLLYKAAVHFRIPTLHVGRARWRNRHLMPITMHDYRNKRLQFDLEVLGINENNWGIPRNLILEFLQKAETGQDVREIQEEIQTMNMEFRNMRMRKFIERGSPSSLSNKPKRHLLR